MESPVKMAPLLTMREAAKALAISERTLFTLGQRGELKPIRIGGARRYDPADIRAWVEARKAASR